MEYSPEDKTSPDTSSELLKATRELQGSPARKLTGNRLQGAGVERLALKGNVEYLKSLSELVEQAGSYQALLSGESVISQPPSGQRNISAKQVFVNLGLNDESKHGKMSLGPVLKGIDYDRLKNNYPKERFKFYSSFDLRTDEQKGLGEEWLGDVAERAYEAGLSLETKAFDHAYDSLNLYTWHPEGVAAIVQELYPYYESKGLYYETPHFFQGEIDGVNPNHVGFVQEPIHGWGQGSHSQRMGVLGAEFDKYVQHDQDIDEQAFISAAKAAQVNPARPYVIGE